MIIPIDRSLPIDSSLPIDRYDTIDTIRYYMPQSRNSVMTIIHSIIRVVRFGTTRRSLVIVS